MTKRSEITDFSEKYMYALLYFCENLNIVNMKSFYYLLLCAVLTFSACSEGEDNPSQLKLADGIPTEIVFGDGETNSVKEIKFVASAPWTASVKETSAARSGSEVDWLTLDKYSGNAGEITLTLTIKDNETSETRKAEIVIVCGDTTITITVEQKPSVNGNEGGNETTDSRLIKTMKACVEGHPEVNSITRYTYDNEGRIIKGVVEPVNGGIPRQTYSFSYSDNKIEISEKLENENMDNPSGEPEITYGEYEADLNENGDAIALYTVHDNGINRVKTYEFSYNEEGRLVEIRGFRESTGNKYCVENFTYENNLLKLYKYDDNLPEEMSDNCTFAIDMETGYTNKYTNNANIDIMAFMIPFEGDYSVLFNIGVVGKTGDFMPEAATFSRIAGNDELKFDYEFDDKDRMTKMTFKEPGIEYVYEFSY